MKTKAIIIALSVVLQTAASNAQGSGGQNGSRPSGPPPGAHRQDSGQNGQQSDGDDPQDRPPHRPPMRPMPLIDALDKDKDGIISAKEIADAPESLKTLDKNGDGQLTPDEVLPPPPPDRNGEGGSPKPAHGSNSGTNQKHGDRPKPPLPPIFKALDTDGDGVISADEIAAAATSLLKLDKNGDGQLGPGEYNPRPHRPEDGQLPDELKPYDKNGDGKLDASEKAAVKADIDSGKLQPPPRPPGGPDGDGSGAPPPDDSAAQ